MVRLSSRAFACICLAACLTASPVARGEDTASATSETKLSLDAAIRLALEKNFTIKVEAFEPIIARAAITEAWGRFDPALKGSYSGATDEAPDLADPFTGFRPSAELTKTNNGSLAIEGELPLGTNYWLGASTRNYRGTFNQQSDVYHTFTGITLTQPLLRGFGLGPSLYRVRIARTNQAISEWDYRLSVTDIITRVIYTYSDLYFAQARLKSALRSREMAAKLHRENEGRRQRGAMSEYDVLSASARVASRENSVLQATMDVQETENALKQLISDERQPALFAKTIAIEPLTMVASTSPDPIADYSYALENRPEYQLARLAIKRGDLNRRYDLNQLLPRIDATGSYGYNGIGSDFASSRQDVRSRDYAAYSAGLSISIPLTSAAERGRYRASKLRLQQAELQLQRLEQSIIVNLSTAAQEIENTRRRVDVTREARRLNEEMLQAELKRLSAGTGSTYYVLSQQEQLSSAETNEALAQVAHRKALADYDRQTGRTLEKLHIEL